jgi:hypothetical protein
MNKKLMSNILNISEPPSNSKAEFYLTHAQKGSLQERAACANLLRFMHCTRTSSGFDVHYDCGHLNKDTIFIIV